MPKIAKVKLRHKHTKCIIKVNADDWARDLGKNTYYGYERVGEDNVGDAKDVAKVKDDKPVVNEVPHADEDEIKTVQDAIAAAAASSETNTDDEPKTEKTEESITSDEVGDLSEVLGTTDDDTGSTDETESTTTSGDKKEIAPRKSSKKK